MPVLPRVATARPGADVERYHPPREARWSGGSSYYWARRGI